MDDRVNNGTLTHQLNRNPNMELKTYTTHHMRQTYIKRDPES